ncbi:sulfurtransferase TusA family protein [Simiduia curdlanivorans]|uniref:Sulfurtransferase TusA family protein n=1 Tax=Simiduia curdlanivorans TaxID=1492769 RepID=A0ABV8V000_9GAMM|nr:sulfurtransferase TusA family protein [Simiduia curdlanivorans]MDN3639145.1 sulfurtransferase TusA family protein [Simiduia curdlanivorans]
MSADKPLPDAQLTIDARHMACPMPLLKAKQGMNQLTSGEVLCLLATDAGSMRDIPAYCKISGHFLIAERATDTEFCYWLQKR